jgi:hypothetical protein
MSGPLFAERLLAGFLADPALADAILGDLTEEWQTRITRDGRIAANLWYWGHVIRTIPYLLRHWCVNATRRDARLRLSAVLVVFAIEAISIVATHVMTDIRLAVVRVMLGSFSAVDGAMPLTLNWLEIAGIPLAVSATCGLAGAYVLGSRSRVAPLVSVAVLGGACVVMSAALPLALQWPWWYMAALPAVLAIATTAGGLMAMLRPLHATSPSAPHSLD